MCSVISFCIFAKVRMASPPVLLSIAFRPASLLRVSRKLSKLTLLISLSSDKSSRSAYESKRSETSCSEL